MKTIYKIKKSKYEMAKRKEKWKSINTPLEKLMMIVSSQLIETKSGIR